MEKTLLLVALLSFSPLESVTACTRNSLEQNLYQLVMDSLAGTGLGLTVDLLNINQFQLVCLNTASTRGEFNSVSVVVDITCSGSACPPESKSSGLGWSIYLA